MRDQLDAKLDAAGVPDVPARYDAGVRDVGVAPDVEACDGGTAGPVRGILCRGDAATPRSPGVRLPEGLCVSNGTELNCGACGVTCEGGRFCVEDPPGSGGGWVCRFPIGT